jgi:3-hydroxyacyl-CoA dehydrogenase/3-hydroxy-2-methylbutyryl-CoA dehydrogenase
VRLNPDDIILSLQRRHVTIAPSLFDSGVIAMMSEKVRNGLEHAMEFPVRAGRPKEFATLVRQSIENVVLNGGCVEIGWRDRMQSKM